MGTANDQIRISDSVKRELERRKREGESYDNVLERLLDRGDDFDEGFGALSDDAADVIRTTRDDGKRKRAERARRLTDE